MTSRGVGDVRRVLGQTAHKSWIAQNFPTPHPDIPHLSGDPLYSFLVHEITSWETRVAVEAREYQAGSNAAAILRWAQDIRRQCAAVRRVLVRYAEAKQTNGPQLPGIRAVLADLATSFSRHPDWREDWDQNRPDQSGV